MTQKKVGLTFCRNLGWSAIVSIVSAAVCIGLAMLGANDAPLLAIIFTLAGPFVALVCAFTNPILVESGKRLSAWVSVLSVIGVIYYGFVMYLICAIIQNPRGLN